VSDIVAVSLEVTDVPSPQWFGLADGFAFANPPAALKMTRCLGHLIAQTAVGGCTNRSVSFSAARIDYPHASEPVFPQTDKKILVYGEGHYQFASFLAINADRVLLNFHSAVVN